MSTDFHVRKKFRWKVQIQRADGQMMEVEVENAWTPEKDYVERAIRESAAAETSVFKLPRGPKGELMPCSGVAAVLVN